MKKLILMLLALMVMSGMVFATADHQQFGVFNPETVLAEYGVQEDAVTQPTVLVTALSVPAEPSSFQAVMAHEYSHTAILSNGLMNDLSMSLKFRKSHTVSAADYFLLL
jgi:hypothetical protein